jgi:2,3,4,5-tetrahydropyridine-2-carboxylate N-succinyltransferase
MQNLEAQIEKFFSDPAKYPREEMLPAIEEVIAALSAGKLRVAEQVGVGNWKVNAWVKKAILLYFRVSEMREIAAGDIRYWDKIQPRTDHEKSGVRVVPPAIYRVGSHAEKGVILMA